MGWGRGQGFSEMEGYPKCGVVYEMGGRGVLTLLRTMLLSLELSKNDQKGEEPSLPKNAVK